MSLESKIEDLLAREHVEDSKLLQLGQKAVPLLIEAFETASGELAERVKRRALYALGILGSDRAVGFLIEAAQNAQVDSWLRRAAVRSLGSSQHPEARTYLESLLGHPEAGLRKNAVLALNQGLEPQADGRMETLEALETGEGVETPPSPRRIIRD
jgi:HEAT repeat protein